MAATNCEIKTAEEYWLLAKRIRIWKKEGCFKVSLGYLGYSIKEVANFSRDRRQFSLRRRNDCANGTIKTPFDGYKRTTGFFAGG